MKLTILNVGEVAEVLRDRYERFTPFFETMFGDLDMGFTFESIPIIDGAPFPDLDNVEAVVIPGSAMGVYDHPDWIDPLRDFIRRAYDAKKPMLGVCFGHQIIADALGGDVRKSEKGWGIGRHVYDVAPRHAALDALSDTLALAASHQDQVIAPPEGAEVFLSSEFTPNAGILYGNGVTISVQPHPEFDVGFSRALVELRRDNPLSDDVIEERLASLDTPVDNATFAGVLANFLLSADKG